MRYSRAIFGSEFYLKTRLDENATAAGRRAGACACCNKVEPVADAFAHRADVGPGIDHPLDRHANGSPCFGAVSIVASPLSRRPLVFSPLGPV